jgi:hypothetical protein
MSKKAMKFLFFLAAEEGVAKAASPEILAHGTLLGTWDDLGKQLNTFFVCLFCSCSMWFINRIESRQTKTFPKEV